MTISDDEMKAIETAFKRIGEVDYISPTSGLLARINRWREFCEQVRTGYPLSIDEYRDSIGGRIVLDLVAESVPADTASKIQDLLAESDRMFLDSTVQGRIRTTAFEDPNGRWSYRIPKILSGGEIEGLRHFL